MRVFLSLILSNIVFWSFQMKPKPIGIVGGAGPMAGASIFERIVSLCGSTYGCYKDADFPEIFLLSFPFSEMLAQEKNAALLEKELSSCLNRVRDNGSKVLAIACNTLHAFLDEREDLSDLIQLPQIIAAEVDKDEPPLVLCTSTSVQARVHRRFFPCEYLVPEWQEELDGIIERILRGENKEGIVKGLLRILDDQSNQTVILGCTELSLFTKELLAAGQKIIDPLDLLASRVLEKSFADTSINGRC